MQDLPSGSVNRRAVDPVVSVGLEQSLIRLQPADQRWAYTARVGAFALGASTARKMPVSRDSAARVRGGRRLDPSRGAAAKARSVHPERRFEDARPGTHIGVISDNHGYLHPAVLEILAGVTHIIHAGDVMDPEILERLAAIAPITAVSGNMDSEQPTSALPREAVGEVAGIRFLVGHKRKRLLRDLAAGAIEGLAEGDVPDLVIYGHDHVPAAAWVDGTLYLDPGSASAPHEEDDGPTVAIVEVRPAGLAVCFVPLERRSRAR